MRTLHPVNARAYDGGCLDPIEKPRPRAGLFVLRHPFYLVNGFVGVGTFKRILARPSARLCFTHGGNLRKIFWLTFGSLNACTSPKHGRNDISGAPSRPV